MTSNRPIWLYRDLADWYSNTGHEVFLGLRPVGKGGT